MTNNFFYNYGFSYHNMNSTEQIGGNKKTNATENNLADGLSQNELYVLDEDQDGKVTEEEFKKGLKKQDSNINAKWTEYLNAFNSKVKTGEKYYAINIKDAGLTSKSQIGGSNTSLNTFNIGDGLSKSELDMLDKNKDGLVTKEEFKDGLFDIYKAAYDGTSADDENTEIRFMSNKNGYYDQTIKEAVEEYMDEKSSLTQADFSDIIKNKLKIDVSDDVIKKAFQNINHTVGTDKISKKSLAALFALADIGSANIANYDYGVKVDFTDGKFTKKDMKELLENLASNTTSTSKYKDMLSNLQYNYIDYAFSVKKIDTVAIDANGSTKEAEKQNDVINSYKNTQNNSRAIINQKIELYKKQMEDLLAKIQLEMDAIDTKVGDGQTNYNNLKKQYDDIKSGFEAKIDALKKEIVNDEINNSTNVIVAEYELTQVKKGKLQNSSAFRSEIQNGFMATLKSFLNEYISNDDISKAVTIENGEAKIKDTFKQKIVTLKNQAQTLINKYPELEKVIKDLLTGQIDLLIGRISSNINEEIEKVQREMNKNVNNNLNDIRNANKQRIDKDTTEQLNDNNIDTTQSVNNITGATELYVNAFAEGNTKIQELRNYTNDMKKEIEEMEAQ